MFVVPENHGSNVLHLELSETSVLTFTKLGFHLSSFFSRSSKLHGGICFAKQGLLAGEEKCQSVYPRSLLILMARDFPVSSISC